jgi:tetratricopeptide (TPR) repeat protein
VTLQSDERGLFSQWAGEVARCNPEALSTLAQLSSDEERVLYCTTLNKVDHFLVEPVFKHKDLELARKKRAEGNTAFQKKWYRQALLLYSVSAVKSPGGPAGEETLAYAYANRSACLYYLGEMQLALADIQLALSHNYPAALQFKLYERMAKCWLQLGGPKERARQALLDGKKQLERQRNSMEKGKLETALKSLQEVSKCLADGQPLPGEAIVLATEEAATVPKLKLGPSKAVREMSSLLSVQHSPSAGGRHVVAAKPIQTGDTLLVEEPFASVLYPDKLGTNCSACFAKLVSVVPCPDCAGVGFCSTACRDLACASFHRVECRYQDLIQGLGCSALAVLALRIVTLHPLEYFKRIRHHLNADTTAVSSHKVPYLALFNMVGLNEQRWTEDVFNRSLMAVGLLKILKAAGYFPQKSETDTFTDDEIFIGSLILHHLNVLQFNAHEIYEFWRGDRTRMKLFKNNLIGLGVYPRASYFNHSCHPGTARINIGNRLVIKALHPIPKGRDNEDVNEEVFFLLKVLSSEF